MHHIVNLEHVALQANKALTPHGVLFLQDFVAESRLQFCETKKRVFEAIVFATGPRRRLPHAFKWPDLANWGYSPFEAVRSGEILEVFRNYLDETELGLVGAIVTLVVFARPGPPRPPRGRRMVPRRLASALARSWATLVGARQGKQGPPFYRLFASAQITDLLIIVDRIVSEAECLKPALAFAVYRKRQR